MASPKAARSPSGVKKNNFVTATFGKKDKENGSRDHETKNVPSPYNDIAS